MFLALEQSQNGKKVGRYFMMIWGRLIAIGLIVNDAKKRSVGLFLVSVYAPVGNADQSEWDAYFDLLNVCVAQENTKMTSC